MVSTTDDYVLGRDLYGSIRLDAQHVIWTVHNGFTMNPKIPISPDMRIAEIGTGTSMWLLDLASRLPKTVTLDGYDISADQFPHKSLLPPNVTLGTMNAFEDVPEHLVGKYDVVHLRFWALIVKGSDPSKVIHHVATLLKPGGYVQWEDAHNGDVTTSGEEADALKSMLKAVYKSANFDFDWLTNLGDHAQKGGLDVLENYHGPVHPTVVPLTTTTYLGAFYELFAGIDRLKDESLPTKEECQRILIDLLAKYRKGEALFHWKAVTLLAQKPLRL
ncbi:N-methyltransferase tcpN [Cladobotryum mycophilum]|uniref:N-methyltransferase tcpN n=1 Tax=Cladobotryum mycophilum TaxID=491253 RepID=A0ABR0SKF7_9HYPO